MKVLLINSVPTEKNGITNVIFNYLSNMDADDIQFDLISINNPEKRYVDVISKKGGKLFVIERIGRKVFSYYSRLKAIIKENQYDIVHVHGNSHTLVLELLAAKFGGCKIRIAHAHNTTCNSIWLHRILTPIFNLLCTHRLACGEEAGRWMFGSMPFKVLNNGVDIKKFAYSEQNRIKMRELYCFEGKKVIGHVGMFIPVKNQSFIVNVFEKLIQLDDTYRLLLIGDGPMLDVVKQKVDNLGLSGRIFFTGGVHNVHEFLNSIDMIVMPSFYEGLPLTLIEQQANGLQCIVADTITKEVDKTGNVHYLSLNDDLAAWVSAIRDTDCLRGREQRSKRACDDITKSGYNIAEEAKVLKKYYRELTHEY